MSLTYNRSVPASVKVPETAVSTYAFDATSWLETGSVTFEINKLWTSMKSTPFWIVIAAALSLNNSTFDDDIYTLTDEPPMKVVDIFTHDNYNRINTNYILH